MSPSFSLTVLRHVWAEENVIPTGFNDIRDIRHSDLDHLIVVVLWIFLSWEIGCARVPLQQAVFNLPAGKLIPVSESVLPKVSELGSPIPERNAMYTRALR